MWDVSAASSGLNYSATMLAPLIDFREPPALTALSPLAGETLLTYLPNKTHASLLCADVQTVCGAPAELRTADPADFLPSFLLLNNRTKARPSTE